ncbi:hypothetical protein [Edaphosphingomonas haloaromaticamans]|uniref:hypothetical protein n=1 Tax=Edaphosphingomonas haloaromaticamans TaxID=653954 RepID=UPI0008A88E86|nr:hypothetical protein [Sphingomonas haloaromaticamans]
MIDLPRSKDSSAHSIKFTINLGAISVEPLRRWDVDRDINRETVWGARLGERVGAFLATPDDHWWAISQHSPLSDVEGEIAHLLVSGVLPFLQKHVSGSDLIALWDTGHSPGLTEGQRLRNLAQLKEIAQRAA